MQLFFMFSDEEIATINRVLQKIKEIASISVNRKVTGLITLHENVASISLFCQQAIFNILTDKDPTICMCNSSRVFRFFNPCIEKKQSLPNGQHMVEFTDTVAKTKKAKEVIPTRFEYELNEFTPMLTTREDRVFTTIGARTEYVSSATTQEVMDDPSIIKMYPCKIMKSTQYKNVFMSPVVENNSSFVFTDSDPANETHKLHYERMRVAINEATHVGFWYLPWALNIHIAKFYSRHNRLHVTQYVAPLLK